MSNNDAELILRGQIAELLANMDIQKIANQNAKKAIESGAIDTDLIRGNDYSHAKAILTITLEEQCTTFRPLSDYGRAMAANLRKFL